MVHFTDLKSSLQDLFNIVSLGQDYKLPCNAKEERKNRPGHGNKLPLSYTIKQEEKIVKFTHEETTVREFIKRCEDIDIYDDVCEELGIAFCGPMALTKEGEKRFSKILDLKVDIYTDPDGYKNAVLKIDDKSEKVWKSRLRLAKQFFEGMAGYCSEENYETWFIELDE